MIISLRNSATKGKTLVNGIAGLALSAISVCAVAQDTVETSETTKTPKTAGGPQREFAGLNFGVGLSLTHDLGSNDRIQSASVVDGIVRVDDENNDVARVMLESHYFFTPPRPLPFNKHIKAGQWGWGPFVALQPGTDEIIEAIGLGVMLGVKRTTKPNDLSSWNIGIGVVVDPNTKVLGNGLEKNQPLPAGETEVRFQEKSQWGFLVLTSFGF